MDAMLSWLEFVGVHPTNADGHDVGVLGNDEKLGRKRAFPRRSEFCKPDQTHNLAWEEGIQACAGI